MLAIIALLAAGPGTGLYAWLVMLCLEQTCIAAILTLWSMFGYLKNAWPLLSRDLKRRTP